MPVASIEVTRPTLDDVFLTLTGRSLREGGASAGVRRRHRTRGGLSHDEPDHRHPTVFSRELRPVLRNPFSVIFGMVQPLVFLALFAPLLPQGGRWRPRRCSGSCPGIVVMTCLFGTSMTGSNLLYEMQTGSHERMLVTPLRRPALLVGRALKEIVPVVAQAALIVAVCIPFGFRLHPAGALLGM